tara:strand:- start:591 stop:1040 length:450 start_codon:yes stop_codon:yes gene_type:complete
VFSNPLEIQCQNKLTEKFLQVFDDFSLEQCQEWGDRKFYDSDIGSCKEHELDKRKVEVCRLLERNSILDWSHQQIISISNFNKTQGVAYKYAIPCWQYGSPSENLKHTYVVRDNLITLKKDDWTEFYIDLGNLTAGYGKSREYLCQIVK